MLNNSIKIACYPTKELNGKIHINAVGKFHPVAFYSSSAAYVSIDPSDYENLPTAALVNTLQSAIAIPTGIIYTKDDPVLKVNTSSPAYCVCVLID